MDWKNIKSKVNEKYTRVKRDEELESANFMTSSAKEMSKKLEWSFIPRWLDW